MDPNLFHVDWSQLMEVLAAIVVLSFIVERALAIVFENEFYIDRFGRLKIKELIAFGVAFFICYSWQFDVLSVLLRGERMTLVGQAITAAVVAGGSKASIKLFQDIMGVKSTAEAAHQDVRRRTLVAKEEAKASA